MSKIDMYQMFYEMFMLESTLDSSVLASDNHFWVKSHIPDNPGSSLYFIL